MKITPSVRTVEPPLVTESLTIASAEAGAVTVHSKTAGVFWIAPEVLMAKSLSVWLPGATEVSARVVSVVVTAAALSSMYL